MGVIRSLLTNWDDPPSGKGVNLTFYLGCVLLNPKTTVRIADYLIEGTGLGPPKRSGENTEYCNLTVSLPEANILAPENQWLEDDSCPFGARPIFRGYCMLLLGRVFDCDLDWDTYKSFLSKGTKTNKISVANVCLAISHRIHGTGISTYIYHKKSTKCS